MIVNKRDKFINKVTTTHRGKYDYSLVNYVDSYTKVIIICPYHGEFMQAPYSHIQGHNCPSCGRVQRDQTCLKKYGVSNPTQNLGVKEKIKQTQKERYGCHPRSTLEVQNKCKETCLRKYGTETSLANKKIQSKAKITKFEKYGDEHYNNKAKAKQTNIDRYGTESPLANKEIQSKVKQTKFERYGNGHYNNREQVKQTNLKRYGVEHHMQVCEIQSKATHTVVGRYGVGNVKQHHLLNIMPYLVDKDWLYNQYVVLKKTASQIAAELGQARYGTILRHLIKSEIEIRKNHQSYASRCWLESLILTEGIEIEYEYSFNPKNKKHRADGFCAETNTIYEFHGDFWHGHPEIFPPDQYHPIIKKKTMGELYQATLERESKIKSLGYNLQVMWEHNYTLSDKHFRVTL